MTTLRSREISSGLLLPSDTHCTDFFIAEMADELRRMESGLGSSKSHSIGDAGDVVSGADSADAAAATASGDDPVVTGEVDCEFGGGARDCRETLRGWRRLRRRE